MEQSPVELSKEGSLETAKAPAVRVLHVDDDAGFLKTAKAILEMQGAFQVETASSVKEAVGKMKTEKYDVVVCDYQMPRKDGLQFLKELREKRNSIPFVVFTGKGREEVAIKALNLGADGYFNKSGEPETVYGELAHGIRQIVDKRRAEQSFLKSEDKYRRLVETLHEGIWVIDKDSRTTFVNPRMAEILGYDIEEMKGRHLFSFMDERGVEIAKRLLERRKQGIKEQHDFEFLRKDGTRVYVTLETAPITDDNGNYSGALASVMDITERKRVEDALRQSKENFESLAENAFDGLLVGTQGGVHAYANKRAAEITGYTVAELLRTTIKKLVHPDESEKILERYRRRIEGRAVPNPCETVIIAKDGRSVPIEVAGARTIWERNPADMVFFRDITERKKMENTLRENERKYRVLVENIPQKIFIKDKNSVYLSCNENYARDLKIKSNEIMGKTDYDFHTEELAEKYRADDKRIMESGKTEDIEEEYIQDGQKLYVHTVKTPVKNEHGSVVGILGIFWDITERKKAEEQIRDSEEQLSQLFMRMPSGVAVYIAVNNGEDFVFTDFNEAAERIEHVSRREIIGKCVTEVFPGVKDFGVFKVFQRVWRTGQSEYFPAALYKDDKDQGTWRESWIYKLPNGSIVAIYNDITQRKKAEEKSRVLNEKLEVVGKLTRHDVRNKLSSVINNVYLAKQSLPEGHKALAYLRDIKLACGQTARILDFAAAYESLGVEDLTLVDVGKAVEEAVSLTPNLKGIKVMNECHGITVIADSLLRQLFYNLIDNSLKHGEKVSQIRFHHEGGKDGLELFYEDDGVGVPKAMKSRILDSAFTVGKGLGYGLPLIKRMIEVYGWQIEEKGEPGKGAKFVITIPMRADSNQKQRHRARANASKSALQKEAANS